MEADWLEEMTRAMPGSGRGSGINLSCCRCRRAVLNEIRIEISDIYIPMKRRNSLDLERVSKLADDILEHGLTMPILVRRDETRFVLVEGLHRLEACKALGERTIKALVVQARRP